MSDLSVVTAVHLSYIQAFSISTAVHFPPPSSYPHVYKVITGCDAQVRS